MRSADCPRGNPPPASGCAVMTCSANASIAAASLSCSIPFRRTIAAAVFATREHLGEDFLALLSADFSALDQFDQLLQRLWRDRTIRRSLGRSFVRALCKSFRTQFAIALAVLRHFSPPFQSNAARARSLVEHTSVIGAHPIHLLETGVLRLRQLRNARANFLQQFRSCAREQIRLGKVAIVMRHLLPAHRESLARLVIPTPCFLLNFSPRFSASLCRATS